MARRPTSFDDPVSQLSAWSSRLAFFALFAAALSVVILRSNLLDTGPALATFGAALLFAAAAILLALASFFVIWRHGVSGLGRSLLGLALGGALLAYPAYLGQRAYRYPMIYDISTDSANPPRFVATAKDRPRDRINYPVAAAQLQRAAYPEIVPLQLQLPIRSTYDVVLDVMKKRKQAVIESVPMAPGRREATIEYTARTPLMGFRDDVVIRISATGNATSRVDLRSASRYGAHDLGANAARLRTLIEEIDEASNNAPDPKPEVPEKPAEKKAPAAKKSERKK